MNLNIRSGSMLASCFSWVRARTWNQVIEQGYGAPWGNVTVCVNGRHVCFPLAILCFFFPSSRLLLGTIALPL